VPTLSVAGWWDQEDFYGPIRIYDALERYDTKHLNYLVVGPWNHGGWSGGKGDRLGPIPFGSDTAAYFREQIQAPWFAYFLKDKGRLDRPEAETFEAGTNTWRKWDAWPPKSRIEERRLYFSPERTLSFEKPSTAGNVAFDGYVSDPSHPVPYRHRPVPKKLRETGADRAERGHGIRLEPPHAGLHVSQRTSCDGAGAEHVVPAHRSQSADLRAEHLSGKGIRFSIGHAPRLSLGAISV